MHGLYYPINLACDQQFLLVKTSFSFHPGNISFSLSLSLPTSLLQLPYLKHQIVFSDAVCWFLTEALF